jgi:hypothetical protein
MERDERWGICPPPVLMLVPKVRSFFPFGIQRATAGLDSWNPLGPGRLEPRSTPKRGRFQSTQSATQTS